MSGNGIRCLAHAALDAGWVPSRAPFRGRHPGRSPRGHDPAPGRPRTTWAQVDMGPVKVRGTENRCNVGHGQLLVDVGNPHLVVLGPDPATVDVARIGPRLEATDAAGLNVEFVTLGPGPDAVTMRVWERGVGETEPLAGPDRSPPRRLCTTGIGWVLPSPSTNLAERRRWSSGSTEPRRWPVRVCT